MSRKIVGIDIQADCLSAVVLEAGTQEKLIDDYCFFPWECDSEAAVDSRQEALQQLAEAIGTEEMEFSVSFPASCAAYRNLWVPFRENRKIKQVLPLEIEPTMPFAMDQTVIDFHKVAGSGHRENTAVLAAVVEKSMIDSLLADLKSVGIQPLAATIRGYPLALEIAGRETTPGGCLVADISQTDLTFFVVASGQIQTIRSMAGTTSAGRSAEAVANGMIHTISAVEDLLQMDFQPEKVFISGIQMDDLFIEQVSSRLGLPVVTTDLLADSGIPCNNKPDAPWLPWQMDNALALAVGPPSGSDGLNFYRRQFAAKKHWMTYRKEILNTGILAGVILFLLVAGLIHDFYSTGKDIRKLDARIETIYKRVFPTSAIEDPFVQQRQLQAKVDEMKAQAMTSGQAEGNVRVIDMLYEVSSLLPKELDIQLSRLVVGPGNVTIAGDTATFNSVDEMKNRLEKGKLFQKVTISSANSDTSGKRVTFKLRLDL